MSVNPVDVPTMTYTFDRYKFSLKIKEIRAQNAQGLRSIAKKSGISASTLSRIEHYADIPSLPVFLSLCSTFSLNPQDYLSVNQPDSDGDIIDLRTLETNPRYRMLEMGFEVIRHHMEGNVLVIDEYKLHEVSQPAKGRVPVNPVDQESI